MSDIHIWNSSHSFSYRAKLPWTLAILHQHRPRARSNNSLYSEQWPPWRPRPLVLPLQGNWILQRPIGVCTVKNYNAHISRTLVKSTAGLGHTDKYETKYFWVFGARVWITENSKIKKKIFFYSKLQLVLSLSHNANVIFFRYRPTLPIWHPWELSSILLTVHYKVSI